MAPKYKLTYFDIRGRGEICRLVFALAGVPYEDCRVQFSEWPNVKPTTPLGTLPVLEVNGEIYSQGLALATFLAREFGLYGNTNLDGLIIDQIQQQREDLLVQFAKCKYAKDEETKAQNEKTLHESTIPTTLKFFCEVIRKNTGGNGYAVGKKISLADLVIYEGTQFCIDQELSILDNYPEIKNLRSLVESGNNVKTYLAERKKTPM